jgi:hypothetical protein
VKFIEADLKGQRTRLDYKYQILLGSDEFAEGILKPLRTGSFPCRPVTQVTPDVSPFQVLFLLEVVVRDQILNMARRACGDVALITVVLIVRHGGGRRWHTCPEQGRESDHDQQKDCVLSHFHWTYPCPTEQDPGPEASIMAPSGNSE